MLKLLWFTNSLMPAVLDHIGAPAIAHGPWMSTLLDALVADHDCRLCVVTCAVGVPTLSVTIDDVRYEVIGDRRKVSYWFPVPDHFQQYEELVRAWGPDVIHIHGTEMNYGALLAEGRLDQPVVISLQGLIGPYAPHVYGNLTVTETIRAHSLMEVLRNTGLTSVARDYRKRGLREQRILRSAQVVLGRTEWDRAYAALVNPNAHYYHVDEMLRPAFHSSEWTLQKCERHTLIFTNCGAAIKGVETVLRSMKLLERKYPDIRARFAGRVSPQSGYGRHLRRYISALNLRDRVEWLGVLDDRAMAQHLLRSHLYITSTHIDNSPNSLAEAQLVGMPVLASYVGGIPSLIDHGHTGLMFPAGDEVTLADQIDKIFSGDGLAAALGCAARVVALRRHARDRVLGQLKNAYSVAITGDFQDGDAAAESLAANV